jgi:hypothetical protein
VCVGLITFQITKSIISLLRYYSWKKFSIITEDSMKSVAESLKIQALNANMTINHFETIFEYHKCCEQNQKCCNEAPWYSLAQETMVNTRSTIAFNIAVSFRSVNALIFFMCSFSLRVFWYPKIVSRHDGRNAIPTTVRQRRLHGHLRRHEVQLRQRLSAILME